MKIINENNNEFGLYIHWPFCLKKCPYCDFNSYAFENIPKEWVDSLIKEIKLYGIIFKNYKLKTIFFGGGTPSLIPPSEIGRILKLISETWPDQSYDIETTLETNPSSIECHDLEEFMKNGINRFSIGVQSLNNDNLKFLGRLHSAEEAIKVLEYAAKICNNVSADFIYTLPQDTLYSWRKDIQEILEIAFKFNLKHLSLYQLTIEPNTGFEQAVLSKKWEPMNEDNQSFLYRHTHKIMKQINWDFYEISNIAKKPDYKCNHNLIYWNYKNYLGIGAGAHSRMFYEGKKYKFNNIKNPYKWKQTVDLEISNELGKQAFLENFEELDQESQFNEKLLMGLRLSEGIEIKKEEEKFIHADNFEILMRKNFIKQNGEKYKLSLNGRLKLNAILKMIIK